MRAEERRYLVKCLLCKPKDLSSSLSSHVKRPGVVMLVCNKRTVGAETGGSLELTDQPT